jgi:hypothetical protein
LVGEMHVDVLRPELTGEWLRISARICGHPRTLRRNGVLFFDVPPRTTEWLAIRGRSDDVHDALLRAVIWSAMEAGGELTMHGRVSTRLLANMERYQEIVCRWWPRYRPVRLRADEELSDEAAARAVSRAPSRQASTVLAYSGGLDSTESLVAHRKGWRGRNTLDIGACVFVHGFDVPLHDAAFDGALRRAEAITGSLSTELVPGRSNLKYLLPPWGLTFSAGIPATLSLFERRFAGGLLTSSSAYENMHWIASEDGSTPWSDHLFSSSTFRLASDLAVTRVEKTQRLAGEPVVWENLRVCWEGSDLSGNCGRCEKCIRQMLCMRACGLEDFSAFSSPLSPGAVRATKLPMAVVVEEWRRCYERALERGLGEDEVFRAMRQVLDEASEDAGRTAGDRVRGLGKLWRRRVRRALAATPPDGGSPQALRGLRKGWRE